MNGETQPNILFILTDEQHIEALGCSGSDLPIETPNIDALAQRGMRFTNAFCCSSICSPSRAALFTGRLPHRFGEVRNDLTIPANTPNLGTQLGTAGYQLGWAGKWHIDHASLPTDHGFQGTGFPGYGYPYGVFGEALNRGEVDTPTQLFRDALEAKGRPLPKLEETRPVYKGGVAQLTIDGRHAGGVESSVPRFVADQAIDHIHQFSGGEAPFYVSANFWGPHNPCYIPEPYYSLVNPADIPEPPSAGDPLTGKPGVQKLNSQYWGAWGAPWSYWQKHLARYLGYCTLIDDEVGRMVSALKKAGQFDNTLIVFASDHGDMMGRHQLMDKGSYMYDDTYRVPLIIAGPDVNQGLAEDFVYLHDMFPTILGRAGAEVPSETDLCQDLSPLLTGSGSWERRTEMYGEFDHQIFAFPQRMIRSHPFKLIYNSTDICEFYDLEEDPHEMDNRVDDSRYAEQRRALFQQLRDHVHRTDDPIRRTFDTRVMA